MDANDLYDAFLLLTLHDCTLAARGALYSGSLALECVTIKAPTTSTRGPSGDSHLYLVLRIDQEEFPVDPNTKVILRKLESGSRKYTFLATDVEPEFVLTIALPIIPDSHFLDDVDVFEGVVAQYADLQDVAAHDIPDRTDVAPNIHDKADAEDLRGHLVLVNQDNGEVVGEFDKKFSVLEDSTLGQRGHENDPVVIEIPESTDADADALEIFARAIPPEQQDWITKSATIISHALTGSTTLLLSAISAASSSSATSSKSEPPPLPPRAVAFLSSARTRKGLAAVHSVSGQAVKVSAKTMTVIDGMIKRAMGNSSKGKSSMLVPTAKPPLPPRTPSPSRSASQLVPPPPYTSSASEKPPLPPRRQPSPSPSTSAGPPLPPRKGGGDPPASGEQGAVKLSKKARILLSADLIWSTLDHSAKRILDSGTQNVGAVVGHKYGAEAAESSLLIAGTAQNLSLVYIDMRGIGRRALLRRAGKEFVKGRLSSK
ncbi:senescence domain-containing protein [Favolaschia claudopus]|uniref:Senescence domain-containing protein n=1 Tax=Favolaschia claudopus TaxID=2862362 RepID=A0AAW0C9W2_9AGAR